MAGAKRALFAPQRRRDKVPLQHPRVGGAGGPERRGGHDRRGRVVPGGLGQGGKVGRGRRLARIDVPQRRVDDHHPRFGGEDGAREAGGKAWLRRRPVETAGAEPGGGAGRRVDVDENIAGDAGRQGLVGRPAGDHPYLHRGIDALFLDLAKPRSKARDCRRHEDQQGAQDDGENDAGEPVDDRGQDRRMLDQVLFGLGGRNAAKLAVLSLVLGFLARISAARLTHPLPPALEAPGRPPRPVVSDAQYVARPQGPFAVALV